MTGPPCKVAPHGGPAYPPPAYPCTHTVRQHTELDALWIPSNACRGEILPHSSFLQEGPGLCDPEQCLPGEQHGGHGHRKAQTPLTTHHASHRVRNKSTFWPRSITHSLERAWLFWNSSSGNMCSWFRFSRLQERREEELDIARKSKGLFRKHWIQS